MGEVCVDYLDIYRTFFDRFKSSVDPSDQLPVKVAGYNLAGCEIPGAIADWTLQYLEQRRCPSSLIAHLIRKVVEEVRELSKIDPISCGFRHEVGDFLSLKLMQVCITKLVDVCARYRDNAELSSLPPPHPLPPVTSCAIKNSRRSMEDRHVVIHDFHTLFNIKGWGPASYYGVLDGHNGVDAAVYSVSHLHQYLAESPHYPADPVKALHDACCKTDDLFTVKAQRENLHGGTTAVVALLRPKEQKLYVAWLGDSQAVLVRQGRPIQIVRPHKPDRPDERDRIEGMGGTVLYWGAWRVNGQLAVSRAIGDVEYKPYVTAEPDIEEITLDGTEHFLILACDGLWDFVSEQQATSAVYKQLRENPEDLEAVSHRLVALSKEQSSQDNISVVVVFLTDPAELAKRPPMETPIPNPFNGAEMFNGQSHHRAPGGHPTFDDEDFGPETDVDMVDDVLLSPAIAAAKALVHGEDDFERQRQQMKEFDDPGDLDRSRDTPTPPAHEVARDVSGDNLAESGGEESEEEWNYIPGNDTASAHPESKQEEEDMNSQLNPNAAEFVPVSPKRLLMDDPIIASSPARGFEKSLDDIQLPSECEFTNEISDRPGDLEYTNGPKHGEDHLENFTTLQNSSKGFSSPSELANELALKHSEMANEPTANFNDLTQEHVPFDKLAALQNMEEKVTSAVLEKANIFGVNSDISNNTFEATNIFGKRDPMTASFIGNDLPASPEPEDGLIPGTPRSTTVEAPTSPTADEAPAVRHTEFDSPVDEFTPDTQKSPDLISPGDGPQDGLISGQERTSSSGFESESGADEVEANVVINEGFVTEQNMRSQTSNLSFEPIQTFSDTNPFGGQEMHPSITPSNHLDIPAEPQNELLQTPKKDDLADSNQTSGDQFDFMQNVPPSFVSPRLQDGETIPFDQLESPEDVPNFAPHPPNANSSFLATELPKSPEVVNEFQNLSPVKLENNETISNNYKTNVNDITQELFSDDTNAEVEETSFTTENPHNDEVSHVDLDSTEGFLETESKIMQDEFDHDSVSKPEHEEFCNELSGADVMISNPVYPKEVDQVLSAFDEIKHDEQISETAHNLQELSRGSDIEVETKEMKLEFESHITNSETLPELNDLGENVEEVLPKDLKKESDQVINLLSPVKETNPFKVDLDSVPIEVESQNKMGSNFLNAVDQFSAAVNEEVLSSESCVQLSSSQEPYSEVEPEVTRIVSYQTLTPANEPQITKSEIYTTGEKVETESFEFEGVVPEKAAAPNEQEFIVDKQVTAVCLQPEVPVVAGSDLKNEPIQSTTVTETLITTLEETSEVPSVATTEVPSSAGTPPPTPAPGLDDSKDCDDTPKTDVLVAAVAAAGAVAAGSAILAEKDAKKTKEMVAKKSTVGAKKVSDVTGKPPAKLTTTKTPAAKPSVPKTTTTSTTNKSANTATKPSTITNKPAAAKPSAASTAAKKSTAAPSAKPAQKTASSAPSKQTSTSLKPVPNKLPLSKTTPSTVKPPSKPSTPTSKPTTPTTPKTPMVKPDVKSPARPGLKSPLATKTSSPKPATDKVAEKKSLTNGDIKPIPKKAEVPKRPTPTTVKQPQSKTAPPTRTSLASKPTAPRTSVSSNAAKPKSTSATTPKPTTIAANRPNTAPSGKTAIGKEAVNKQVLNKARSAVNGKAAPTKTLGGVKKTDPKLNAAKPDTKPPPIKKPEDFKKEEDKASQIQEPTLSTTTATTNGFADHNEEQESLKIEDLAPMTVETVN